MSKKRQGPKVLVRALSVRYSAGFVLASHAHDWHQLLHASEGVMVVETDHGSWVVPPHRAVWLPARVEHCVTMRGSVAMKTLYFAEEWSSPLRTTCVVSVSPLLRELLVYCAGRGKLDVRDPHDARLAGLIDDLLRDVAAVPLELPMPRDRRALRVATAIREGSKIDVRRAGASVRTIERLFVEETGMTLGRWRQQARLLHALTLLAEGAPVTKVALDVGYATPSAFIAMFKNVLGTTPSRFFDA
jgi:hypothetical protein